MSKRPLRVLCVDDHAFLAEGMKSRLSIEADMEIVGWLESAEGLSEEVRQRQADIVLMDIEMPGPDVFEVLADLCQSNPQVRTIMLSAYVRDHYIDAAAKAGAWGYLSKSDTPDSVVDAIRKVVADEFAFGPKVLERCQPDTGASEQQDRPTSRLEELTTRETQILRLIGKGMSRVEIASAIHRSPKTVDNHRAAIMRKLAIHDRVELARYALREGLTEA